MKQLDQLPEIADEMLGDMVAGQELKVRILTEARGGKVRRTKPIYARAAAIAAAAVLLLGGSVYAVRRQSAAPATAAQDQLVRSVAAGSDPTEVAVLTADAEVAKELKNNSLQVSSQQNAPGYHSLWVTGKSTFPLIGIQGQYYRMLSEPTSVSSSLLGSAVGTVQEYTSEPALASQSSVMSNVVEAGTTVYGVKGMTTTLVAAEVNGAVRVFQRVSFNGTALRGSEKLSDTLQLSGHVSSIELSNVGVVEGKDACEKLLKTLLSSAVYESSGSLNNKQSLTFTLDNGLSVQMLVKGDRVAACGVWSCPDFFEAFEAALQ